MTWLPIVALASLVLVTSGCARQTTDTHAHAEDEAHGHSHEHEPWSVTSWGARYEIFAEAAPLAAGETVESHTHVTVLAGFQPLKEGAVSAWLIDSTGATTVFTQSAPVRPGIFSIEITPPAAGTYDLVFNVQSPFGEEDIVSGRVRVGSHEDPGVLVQPPPAPGGSIAATEASGDPVSFLKEQQWRIPFATEWAREGALHPSVSGPGRVRAAAGGEVVIAAPLDGVVSPASRLYVGLPVARGRAVVQLRPRVASGRSYAEIESEARLAGERLQRLEQLFAQEAVSRAELERARERAATLRAELDAVRGGGRTVPVLAPFSGRLAEVRVTPGEAVAAGDAIARLVQTDPLWVEVGLRPEDAARIGAGALAGLSIAGAPGEPPVVFGPRAVRLVSRAPEVDRATGLVPILVEARGAERLRPGAAVTAEVLLPGERRGIVLPAEAVVDDAGVPVVFAQAEGESFVRHAVRVIGRQGNRALVEGVGPADRVVTRGGAAIRRAAQMSSGAVEGHVH